MRKPIKVKLINNWKDAWRFWSVRLSALGAAILTMVDLAPGAIASVWTQLPRTITDSLPDDMIKWIGIGLIVASPLARVIRQSSLDTNR